MVKGVIDTSILQNLADVNVKYLQGELDVITPKKSLETFLEHVPHANYDVINDGSHVMIYTHDKKICALIKDWLQNTSNYTQQI